MNAFETEVQVRYSETDAMGVAHHSSYIPWLELARIRFLDEVGISYKSLEESGVVMPVVSLTINYKHPCTFDDQIVIRVLVNELPRSRMTVNYEIRLSDKRIAEATTVLAFVDLKSLRPIRPPSELYQRLEKWMRSN